MRRPPGHAPTARSWPGRRGLGRLDVKAQPRRRAPVARRRRRPRPGAWQRDAGDVAQQPLDSATGALVGAVQPAPWPRAGPAGSPRSSDPSPRPTIDCSSSREPAPEGPTTPSPPTSTWPTTAGAHAPRSDESHAGVELPDPHAGAELADRPDGVRGLVAFQDVGHHPRAARRSARPDQQGEAVGGVGVAAPGRLLAADGEVAQPTRDAGRGADRRGMGVPGGDIPRLTPPRPPRPPALDHLDSPCSSTIRSGQARVPRMRNSENASATSARQAASGQRRSSVAPTMPARKPRASCRVVAGSSSRLRRAARSSSSCSTPSDGARKRCRKAASSSWP